MRGLPRRQVLAAIVLAPAVLGGGAGCGLLRDDPPDPLVALADQARADAALAAAVVAADVVLTARVEPVRSAREAHAAALTTEIIRRDRNATTTRAEAPPAASQLPATLAGLRDAVADAAEGAAAVALRLPADRVGLVASVAACCGAYAELLS